MTRTILHSATLASVLMVEETIQKLPRKMMYQTFQLILDYLQESGKIIIDKDGCIIWTHNPKRIKKLIAKDLLAR